MATAYSSNLALALPVTGELSGTWGTTVNTQITNMLDEALGYQTFSATGSTDTLTIPDGTTGVARSIYIQLNGTGGGTVTVPTAKTKMYFVFNNTAAAITFKVTGQTGVSIPAAAKMALFSNGTDIFDAENYFSALTLGSALPVASGGTGITSFGTGVATALGVNTGTAGAFVVNGGALGSPSSVGTMPAFTLGGTVSGGGNQINNVIIGTTTPLAGNFTTLSSTVADATAGFRAIATTGRLVVYPYNTAGTGVVINSMNTAESAYQAMTIQASALGIAANTAVTGTLSATAAGASGADDRIFTVTNTTANSYGAMTLVGTSRGGYLNFYNGATAQAAIVGQASALDIYAGSNSSGSLVARFSSTALALQTGISLTGGTSGTGYSFSGSAPATSLTLDASGNLGIGTSSLSQKLTVSSAETSGTAVNIINTSTGGYSWNIFSVGSAASLGPVGSLVFRDSTNGATRALIDSSGNLLVGKTASSNSTVGFQVVGTTGETVSTMASAVSAQATFAVYSTGAAAYRFYVGMDGVINATNTSINAISDIRLKENVRDLDAGLDKVMALKPRLYDWKEGKGANIKNARGFIAQEFEQIFPDLVDDWRDPAPEGEAPYKSVRQDLIPVLVKAIQEQQALITSLTARIEALEST